MDKNSSVSSIIAILFGNNQNFESLIMHHEKQNTQ